VVTLVSIHSLIAEISSGKTEPTNKNPLIKAVFASSAALALLVSPEIAEPKFVSAYSKFYCKVSIFPCKEVN